jgi:hypothetical protein
MFKELEMNQMIEINGGDLATRIGTAITIEGIVAGALTEGLCKVTTGKSPGEWATEGIKHVVKELTSPENKKELQNNSYVKIFGGH